MLSEMFNLKYLACDSLTDEGVGKIRKLGSSLHYPIELEKLDLSGCPNVKGALSESDEEYYEEYVHHQARMCRGSKGLTMAGLRF